MFTCLFVLVGIGLVGAALGIVGGYILDKQDAMAEVMAERLRIADGEHMCALLNTHVDILHFSDACCSHFQVTNQTTG